jgi:hypothetical protein
MADTTCLFGRERRVIAQAAQTLDQIASALLRLEFVKVVRSEVLVIYVLLQVSGRSHERTPLPDGQPVVQSPPCTLPAPANVMPARQLATQRYGAIARFTAENATANLDVAIAPEKIDWLKGTSCSDTEHPGGWSKTAADVFGGAPEAHGKAVNIGRNWGAPRGAGAPRGF